MELPPVEEALFGELQNAYQSNSEDAYIQKTSKNHLVKVMEYMKKTNIDKVNDILIEKVNTEIKNIDQESENMEPQVNKQYTFSNKLGNVIYDVDVHGLIGWNGRIPWPVFCNIFPDDWSERDISNTLRSRGGENHIFVRSNDVDIILNLMIESIFYKSGRKEKLLYIHDTLVDKRHRWKGVWSNLEGITQDIARMNNCDAIIGLLVPDDKKSEDIIYKQKKKNDYEIIDGNMVKVLSENWKIILSDIKKIWKTR